MSAGGRRFGLLLVTLGLLAWLIFERLGSSRAELALGFAGGAFAGLFVFMVICGVDRLVRGTPGGPDPRYAQKEKRR